MGQVSVLLGGGIDIKIIPEFAKPVGSQQRQMWNFSELGTQKRVSSPPPLFMSTNETFSKLNTQKQ